MLRLHASLLVAVLGVACTGFAQGNKKPERPAPQYGQPPQDLANALVQMARASHVPLIAELALPLPMIPTSEGVPLDAATLKQLVKQAPGYTWENDGKAIHFYSKKLRNARYNFLHVKFDRFTVPPNLSDLKLWLPGRATGLLQGFSGEGGATTGFGDPQLENKKLQRATLQNVTPLEVLAHIANESPTFYAVIVFPGITPTKDQAEKQVSWHWGSLDEKLKPLYTQSLNVTSHAKVGAGSLP